jgi:hypothetical protein
MAGRSNSISDVVESIKEQNSGIQDLGNEIGDLRSIAGMQLKSQMRLEGVFSKYFQGLNDSDLQRAEAEMDKMKRKPVPAEKKESRMSNRHIDSPFAGIMDALGRFVHDLFPMLPFITRVVGEFTTALAGAMAALGGLSIGFISGLMKSHGIDIEKAVVGAFKIATGAFKITISTIDRVLTGIFEDSGKLAKKKMTKAKVLKMQAEKLENSTKVGKGFGAESRTVKLGAAAEAANKAALELRMEALALEREANDIKNFIGPIKRMLKLDKVFAVGKKIKDAFGNGIETLFKEFKSSGFMKAIAEIAEAFSPKSGGVIGKLFSFFEKIGSIFSKFKVIGSAIGKIFAPIEAAWYVVTAAFDDWKKSVDDGAGLLEQGVSAIAGAGKGALTWLLSLPSMLIDLIKDYVIAPVLGAFGMDQIKRSLKNFSVVDFAKEFVNEAFDNIRRVGEWIGTWITNLIPPFIKKMMGDKTPALVINDKVLEDYNAAVKRFGGNVAKAKEELSKSGASDSDINIAAGAATKNDSTRELIANYNKDRIQASKSLESSVNSLKEAAVQRADIASAPSPVIIQSPQAPSPVNNVSTSNATVNISSGALMDRTSLWAAGAA